MKLIERFKREQGNNRLIFSETSFDNATNFPISGTGITRGTNKLDLTGNPTLFTSFVRFDNPNNAYRYTCIEKWKQRLRVKTPTTLTATSYGIGIGVKSSNGYAVSSTMVRWSWDTSGAGRCYLYNVDAITNQIVSGTSLVATANTYYWVDVERAKNVITTTIFSDVGAQLFQVAQTFSITSGSTVANNTGQFAIHQFGGTANEVTSWTVTNQESFGVDYLFIGDSNTHGLHAATNAARWPEIAAATASKTFAVHAGISDRTAEVILRLPEIIALKPRNVIITIGRNDIANSVDEATREANLDTIIATLEAAGITVKLAGTIASNVNVSTMQTHMNGKSNQKVDFYQASKAAASSAIHADWNSGDNIHINIAGHAMLGALAATIMN